MTDNSMQRALVQRLESLRRAGVLTIPSPQWEPDPTATATATATAAATDSAEVATAAPPAAEASRPAPAPAVPAAAPVAAPPAAPPQPAATSTAASPPRGTPDKSPVTADGAPLTRPADPNQALTVLADEVAACELCPQLVKSRSRTVFGVGNPNARLLFFGEAPGADEDRMGEPFVGAAGQLLTKIIEACTLRREDVYIMNVLKCRPPRNRNPLPEEAERCRPFFERQIAAINPEYICCLGAVATSTLLGSNQSVGRLRGRLHQWRGIPVMATYHPAYLLRTPDAKRLVWADMKFLMNEMGIEIPQRK